MAGLLSTLRALVRSPLSAASLVVFVLIAAGAVLAPWLGLADPHVMTMEPLVPPGAGHLLGTDNFGRDIFARFIWGARVSLEVALGSAVLTVLLGVTLGALAGYFGGNVDRVVSRIIEAFLLMPTFFLVLVAVSIFGTRLSLTISAIALTSWPRSARIMRSQVLSIRSRVYVQAAEASGASPWRVLRRHVVPNAIAPVLTDGAILMGFAILTEAGLSFLGLGDQRQVSWGMMVLEGQRYLRMAPWMSVAPGIGILLLVGSLNIIGDALNRHFTPTLSARRGRRARRAPISDVPAGDPGTAPLLSVDGLSVVYQGDKRDRVAVEGVSLSLARGDSLGLIGESGSGKSSLAAAILQTLPPNADYVSGAVAYRGEPLVADGRIVWRGGRPAIQALRWTRLSAVFQGSMNALNPVTSVRRQFTDAYRQHKPHAAPEDIERRVLELFAMIGISADRLDAYPHQLSGGMRQRLMIALSILHEPELVIADEPTTALDVVTQRQILVQISKLRRSLGLSMIFISHDIGAVRNVCDRVAVMYAGRLIETGPADVVFSAPAHPYTRILLDAIPDLTGPKRALAGAVVDPEAARAQNAGCRFAPACPRATEVCWTTLPPAVDVGDGHRAECHHVLAPSPAPALRESMA